MVEGHARHARGLKPRSSDRGVGSFAYDRKTLNAKFTISQDGKRILYADNDRRLYDFPIFVGKKWTDTGTNFMSEFKIEGIEVATTAVGTFKAYLL